LGRITDRYLSAVADVLRRGKARGVIHYGHERSVVEAIHMLCAGWATGANYLKDTTKESYWREISAIIEGRLFAANANAANGPAPR
jgi:hypothetical protein